MRFKPFGFLTGILLLGAMVCGNQAQAQSRKANRLGLGLGVLSDPVPTLISYQVKYNLMPWLQLGAGYGSIKAAAALDPTTGAAVGGGVTSYGASVKAFLLPSWSFSPYVSAGYSMTKIEGAFTLSGKTVDSASDKLNVMVVGGGLDHQAYIGFNIGAGVNMIMSPSDISDVIKMLPHVYFGWFFF